MFITNDHPLLSADRYVAFGLISTLQASNLSKWKLGHMHLIGLGITTILLSCHKLMGFLFLRKCLNVEIRLCAPFEAADRKPCVEILFVMFMGDCKTHWFLIMQNWSS